MEANTDRAIVTVKGQTMWQDQIKAYRDKHNLTQEALARKLNIALWTLHRWERGKTQPSRMAQEKLKREGITDD